MSLLDSSTSAPSRPTPRIDSSAYPHIVEAIASHADGNTLLAIGLTSHHFLLLSDHILLRRQGRVHVSPYARPGPLKTYRSAFPGCQVSKVLASGQDRPEVMTLYAGTGQALPTLGVGELPYFLRVVQDMPRFRTRFASVRAIELWSPPFSTSNPGSGSDSSVPQLRPLTDEQLSALCAPMPNAAVRCQNDFRRYPRHESPPGVMTHTLVVFWDTEREDADVAQPPISLAHNLRRRTVVNFKGALTAKTWRALAVPLEWKVEQDLVLSFSRWKWPPSTEPVGVAGGVDGKGWGEGGTGKGSHDGGENGSVSEGGIPSGIGAARGASYETIENLPKMGHAILILQQAVVVLVKHISTCLSTGRTNTLTLVDLHRFHAWFNRLPGCGAGRGWDEADTFPEAFKQWISQRQPGGVEGLSDQCAVIIGNWDRVKILSAEEYRQSIGEEAYVVESVW